MKGYCVGCVRVVEGVKKNFSFGWFFLGFGVFYGVYRVLFVRKNRCPICGLKLQKRNQ